MTDSDASFWPARKSDVQMAQESLISINVRRPEDDWRKFESSLMNEHSKDSSKYGEKEVRVELIFIVNEPRLQFLFPAVLPCPDR